jgi:hypothetical protein
VMLNACTTKDFGKVNRTIKKAAKEYCARLSDIWQRMVSGESGDYKDELSADDSKTTTYMFADGKVCGCRNSIHRARPGDQQSGQVICRNFQRPQRNLRTAV